MTTLQVSAQKQLRQLIEQIERLEEEKKALAGDIRDKYLEAKAVGFDVKIMRKIMSLRKKSQTDRQEEDAMLAVYLHALGMIDEAPRCPSCTQVNGRSRVSGRRLLRLRSRCHLAAVATRRVGQPAARGASASSRPDRSTASPLNCCAHSSSAACTPGRSRIGGAAFSWSQRLEDLRRGRDAPCPTAPGRRRRRWRSGTAQSGTAGRTAPRDARRRTRALARRCARR